MSIVGNKILGKDICNALLTDSLSYSHDGPFCIFSHALTNQVVTSAINLGAEGIITTESSFATHGANILRSYHYISGKEIAWISISSFENIDALIGKHINIINGVIDSSEIHPTPIKTLNKSYGHPFVAQPKKCIVNYNIKNRKYKLCYWPHRSYDTFTFSIMQEGLKQNYKHLLDKDVQITRDCTGRIWFDDGVLLEDIIHIVRHPLNASPFLQEQVQLYSDICNTLTKEDYNLPQVIEYLIKYFSHFLLLHNTYEQLFEYIYELVSNQTSLLMAEHFMNSFMFCKIDYWMMKCSIPLEKHKDLFANEAITPIPFFQINEDINEKISHVYKWFCDYDLKKFYLENIDIFNYWVKVFVVKEWKFVINKILFTRFANLMIKNYSQEDINSIRTITYKQFLQKYNQN